LQGTHDPDVRKAARRAASQHKAYRGSAALDRNMTGVDGFVRNIDGTQLNTRASASIVCRAVSNGPSIKHMGKHPQLSHRLLRLAHSLMGGGAA
jgi:hypothetical protein